MTEYLKHNELKKILVITTIFLAVNVFGQTNPTKKAQPIVAEGKLLYKSEMASWFGTDIFLETYKQREKIGGYFSYTDNEISKCIFFSREDSPKVIGTISFDSTYSIDTAITDLAEREFTNLENDLYNIREKALTELKTNTDDFFKFYQNTSPNIIPLINKKEKKVYILTGPKESGVVIFGNDYLLTYNKNNKLIEKKQLHKNIIPIEYGNIEEDKQIEGAMHSHLPETGDFITATDICTLMLYQKLAKWKTHNVISKKYLNVWNCETNELTVISMDVVKKINEDQEKQKKK